jgi:DNA-binding FadR family transcriptional regulator
VIDELRLGTVHPTRFIERDTHFHRVIHVAARNALLLALLDGVGALAERSRTITGRQPGLLASTIRAHVKIYDALAARDPVAARRAMLEHLDEIREVLNQLLEQTQLLETQP